MKSPNNKHPIKGGWITIKVLECEWEFKLHKTWILFNQHSISCKCLSY